MEHPDQNVKGGYQGVEDKSVWLRIKFKHRYLQWAEIIINPQVTIISLAIIIAFVCWSVQNADVASQEFGTWQSWIRQSFTWFYIGSQDIWGIFILYIVFSKYSTIKLGREDSSPEFSDATWFAMLFSCGVSTGLFFFGVAEPVYHYTGKNRYSADPTMPDNTLAQEAVLVTLYHWGLHGWVVYTIVGLILALMTHREGLPMTMKSCFYPLIGDKVFGWPGDLVDILSVIATLFGVCTSLGLGTIQINQGLHMLNSSIEISEKIQVIIIWVITLVATSSVVTGMKYGIRRISEFCFTCGCLLMLAVLFLDNTVFLLNLYVQSIGHYFQWLIQIGFHSDAFEQLGPSYGSEDRDRFLPEGVDSTDGPTAWMELWTIFYWGWWIAWCPFVGMFIAKISYGRTIKEFIVGTMAAPTVYVFMWMIIFGGSGLRMEREAANQGLCCHNLNTSGILNITEAERPDLLNIQDMANYCDGDACNKCSLRLLGERVDEGLTKEALINEITLSGESNWGLTTQNRRFTRLSCRKVEQMWFDLMMSYGDLGDFLSGFSLMSLILYFVTSSDSGSLIIDCLASNGHPEPPTLQRILWALIEGMTATSLLVAGGEKALNALQAVSIATGLIYTILMCIACLALFRAIQVAAGELPMNSPAFKIDFLDPLLADPLKELFSSEHWKTTKYKLGLVPHLLLNVVIAPYSIAKSCAKLEGAAVFLPKLLVLYLLILLIIIFHSLTEVVDGIWVLAWIAYIMFATIIGSARSDTRTHFKIPGSKLEDFLLSLCLYPSAALQIVLTVDEDANLSFNWREIFSIETYRSCENDLNMSSEPREERAGRSNPEFRCDENPGGLALQGKIVPE